MEKPSRLSRMVFPFLTEYILHKDIISNEPFASNRLYIGLLIMSLDTKKSFKTEYNPDTRGGVFHEWLTEFGFNPKAQVIR